MKKSILAIAFLAATCASLSAQTVINGDLNHDGKMDVNDVTSSISTVLGERSPEYISGSGETDHFQVDNSKIEGTWYATTTSSIIFNADSTTSLIPGATYKFRPCQGKLALYRDGYPNVIYYDVVECDSERLVIGKNGEGTVYTRTRPAYEENVFEANGVSFKMISVAGGTFQMGATEEQLDKAFDTEKPVHSVTLSDFAIGQTEVTQGLWYAVMGKSPTSSRSWTSSYGLGDNYPAYYISYSDCEEFITKLNELTGMTFRLPTEAEWEYAARGGLLSKGYKYAGSNTIDDVCWYEANSDDTNHIVASKAPNELGIYDMSGNLEEWCSDWEGQYTADAQTNPTGPTEGTSRIIRGGCRNNSYFYCRVSSRYAGAPTNSDYSLGFRLARSINK